MDLENRLEWARHRLDEDIARDSPRLAAGLMAWRKSLSKHSIREGRFQNGAFFPFLSLPYWLDESQGRPRSGCSRDLDELFYGALNGYYCLRLQDNILDGEMTTELELRPVADDFEARFRQSIDLYLAGIPAARWVFDHYWKQSIDSMEESALSPPLGRLDYLRSAIERYSAAKIPLAAVAIRRRRLDVLEPWLRVCDLLACACQVVDDLFDWHQDLKHGRHGNYLLSCHQRTAHPSEDLTFWCLAQGWPLGVELIDELQTQVRRAARELRSPGLDQYIGSFQRSFDAARTRLEARIESAINSASTWTRSGPGCPPKPTVEHTQAIGSDGGPDAR